MATVYTDIQDLNAAFASLTQGQIDPYIERATRRIDSDFFGDLFDDAVLYLSAHLLAQSRFGGGVSGGVVSSKTVGPLSVSYATSNESGAPPDYAGSSYGVQYWSLVRSLRYKTTQAV